MNDKKANYKYYIGVVLCFIVLVITATYYYSNEAEVNAFFRFDEKQIIGHSKAEIIEKYGEFDRIWIFISEHEANGKIAKYGGLYRLARARDWHPVYGIYYYYWIFFSEDDIALTTEISIPPDEQ